MSEGATKQLEVYENVAGNLHVAGLGPISSLASELLKASRTLHMAWHALSGQRLAWNECKAKLRARASACQGTGINQQAVIQVARSRLPLYSIARSSTVAHQASAAGFHTQAVQPAGSQMEGSSL